MRRIFNTFINDWKVFSACAVAFLFATTIVDVFRLITVYIFVDMYYLVDIFRNTIYAFLMVYFYTHMILNIRSKRVIIIGVAGLSYLLILYISVAINNNIIDLARTNAILLIGRLLPALYIGMMIVGNGSNIKILGSRYISTIYVAMLLLCYHFFQPSIPSMSITMLYVPTSLNLILPSLLFIFVSYYYGKWKVNIALFLINLTYILLYGSRGALIYVLIPLFILTLFYLKNNNKNLLFIVIAVVVIISLLLIWFSSDIISFMLTIFPNSRTLRLISENSYFSISSRINLLSPSIHAIQIAPFTFRGLFADSVYSSEANQWSIIDGIYAHNLFVELLVDFGVVFGGIIIIAIISMTIITISKLIKYNNLYFSFLFLAFVLFPFIESMVAGSFTSSHYLWMGLGVLLEFSKPGLIRTDISVSLK